MGRRVRVQAVDVLEGTSVRLRFTNGEVREVDLAPYLHGPVFEPIRGSREVFRTVRVDPELGTIVWPNGADVDPDVLYQGLTPSWREASEPASR